MRTGTNRPYHEQEELLSAADLLEDEPSRTWLTIGLYTVIVVIAVVLGIVIASST